MKANSKWLVALLMLLMMYGLFVSTGTAQVGAQTAQKSAKAQTSRTPSAGRPVILSGEVQAVGAQSIVVPPSNSSPVVIRFFVPEGASVKKGDVVLRIDVSGGSQNETQITQQLEQARARAAKDISNFRVAVVDAELALATAVATTTKAAVDAKLPKQFVSALDFDRYQNEAKRTAADQVQKQNALSAAKVVLSNAEQDARAEQQKLGIELAFASSVKARSEVIAEVDGVVTHGFSEWRGRRIDEGESAMPGNEAGKVVAGDQREVIAYALEADRVYLQTGQAVALFVDALFGKRLDAEINEISQSPETRAVWGSGRYFRIRIALKPEQALGLVPGMSVRVEPLTQVQAADISTAPKPSSLSLEGEVSARVKSSIAPPAIKDVWQYTLVMLAPEGSLVKKGQPVAIFDGTAVQNNLSEKTRKLDEVQKQLRQLDLSHAEADKQNAIASAEAKANLERAERKADQPAELIKRVDYDKLVIERKLASTTLNLTVQKEALQQLARAAERREKQVELQLLEAEIATLQTAQKQLSVTPANDGIVIHGQAFNGDKFTTGSQVFQGLAVASVADAATLRVDALVPEADADLVRIGQSATIRFGTAGASLNAKVVGIGNVFRRKGRTQPTIVRDLQLDFAEGSRLPAELKPGLAVQITIHLERKT
jgi:multidrug resistance efflux pump